MKIAITGATGLVGTELSWSLFKQNHELIFLSRSPEGAKEKLGTPGRYISKPSKEDLEGVDAVINLAGESVAEKRWSRNQKDKIYQSRIQKTRELVTVLNSLKKRPQVLISASATGYYGERGDQILTEESSKGVGFLSDVSKDWESEALKFDGRAVLLRTGIVLSHEGGALQKMKLPFELGAGGRLGSGKQWMSWIHIDDVIGLIEFALHNQKVSGPINLVTPHPVTNSEFTKCLSGVIGLPALFPVPKIALKLAVGEMSEVILGSQRVVPKAVPGYEFKFPVLKEALQNLVLPFGEERLFQRQWFKNSPQDIFEFFSDAKNLQTITPDWLDFKIKKMSTSQIGQDTLLDYRLKIKGVPIMWRSHITKWKPGKSFADVQLKGPYSKWEHQHDFEEIQGGTLVTDHVVYKVPGGPARKLIGSFVRRDVTKIFEFRRSKLSDIFKS